MRPRKNPSDLLTARLIALGGCIFTNFFPEKKADNGLGQGVFTIDCTTLTHKLHEPNYCLVLFSLIAWHAMMARSHVAQEAHGFKSRVHDIPNRYGFSATVPAASKLKLLRF